MDPDSHSCANDKEANATPNENIDGQNFRTVGD